MLLGGGLVLFLFAEDMAAGLKRLLTQFLERPDDIRIENISFVEFLQIIGSDLAIILLLPMLLLIAAAIAGSSIVSAPTWAPEKLKPDLGKFSPIKGAKRIFGSRGLVELANAAFKLAVISSLAAIMVLPSLKILKLVPTIAIIDIVKLIEDLALIMFATVLVVMAFIAIADMVDQKYKWAEDHKMTREGLKEERKQQEGDPKIKSRIRRIRMERSMARVAATIPQADVVITNPTHYAVALKYDEAQMAAPVLIAKGVDHLALTIRSIAEEHDIPVIENPPLARAMYNDIDIDQQIPAHFYKAAAEIIGYVLRLKGRLPGPPGRRRKQHMARQPSSGESAGQRSPGRDDQTSRGLHELREELGRVVESVPAKFSWACLRWTKKTWNKT